jgi:hypothetical protein
MIFQADLARSIIRGDKRATRRRMVPGKPRSPWYRHGCSYKVGQVFTVNPGRGIARVAEAKITAVYSQRLGQMTEKDAKLEGCKNLKHFRETWKAINKVWNPAEEVWVIEFELDGSTCMGCDGCGWCEGSPAFLCDDCYSTGIEVTAAGRALMEADES